MTTPCLVLCATDLERDGRRAVDLAIAAARALEGRVELVHATDSARDAERAPDSIAPAAKALSDRVRERVADEAGALEEERARVSREGITAHAFLVEGRPWEGIVHMAADHGAALIVLGRRPNHASGFLGRTVEHVVRHARCPVLVAPPEGRIPEDVGRGHWIVGTDFSRHSLSALRAAKVLADRMQGEVVLIHVTTPIGEPDRSYADKSPQDLLREATLREERRALESLAESEVPGAKVISRETVGRPYQELCAAAEELDATMIVVGTHGRGGISRLFLGSTTERLLRHARWPVLVLRDEPPQVEPWTTEDVMESGRLTPTHILVAVDFSDASRRALEMARGLCDVLDVPASVVHVHEPVHDIQRGLAGRLPAAAEAHVDSDTTKGLRDGLARIVGDVFSGSRARATVRVGRALDEILAAARENGADLIVVGTTGRTGLERLLLGSTAEKLVRQSPVAVLTVH